MMMEQQQQQQAQHSEEMSVSSSNDIGSLENKNTESPSESQYSPVHGKFNSNSIDKTGRQRVFPRTNPAFCRRNRQTTVVGLPTEQEMKAQQDQVELFPGGIVYEASSNNQHRSHTLDSRVRSSSISHTSNKHQVPAKSVMAPVNNTIPADPHPPFSQPLERKFTYSSSSNSSQQQQQQEQSDQMTPSNVISPLPLDQQDQLMEKSMTPRPASQRSLNKDSLDSGYLPSDHHHHHHSNQMNQRNGSFRRPSTSSSSEPLSSSLERSPSPVRHHRNSNGNRRRPNAGSRRRHGNPPSTIFEPPASGIIKFLDTRTKLTLRLVGINLGKKSLREGSRRARHL